MFPYYFILIVEIILFLFLNKHRKKDQKECLLITMLLLFFFSAFRDITVGGDLERYLPEFNSIANESLYKIVTEGYGTRERGFAIFEKIISLVCNSSFAFILANSVVCIYLAYRSIKFNSCNYILSSLLFTLLLYTNSFNILRASIAVLLGLNMMQSIVNRKVKTFYLLLILATSIQKTSIVMVPMYYLWNLNFRAKGLYIIIGCSIIASFILTGSSIIDILTGVFGYTFKDDGELDFWSETSSGLTTMSIFLTGITIYSIFVYSRSKRIDKISEFFIFVLTIATCFQFFSSIFTLVNRFSLFYYSYIILAIPYLFKNYPKAFPPLIRGFIIIAFIMLYIKGLSKDVQHIVPYKFIFI